MSFLNGCFFTMNSTINPFKIKSRSVDGIRNPSTGEISRINSKKVKLQKVESSHRYLIKLDCSSGQFKSAKLNDKEYTNPAVVA